ncbi:unnamed protein product, partial [Amoebophrya sp. A120]|eukprot:GSA120T00025307001.1
MVFRDFLGGILSPRAQEEDHDDELQNAYTKLRADKRTSERKTKAIRAAEKIFSVLKVILPNWIKTADFGDETAATTTLKIFNEQEEQEFRDAVRAHYERRQTEEEQGITREMRQRGIFKKAMHPRIVTPEDHIESLPVDELVEKIIQEDLVQNLHLSFDHLRAQEESLMKSLALLTYKDELEGMLAFTVGHMIEVPENYLRKYRAEPKEEEFFVVRILKTIVEDAKKNHKLCSGDHQPIDAQQGAAVSRPRRGADHLVKLTGNCVPKRNEHLEMCHGVVHCANHKLVMETEGRRAHWWGWQNLDNCERARTDLQLQFLAPPDESATTQLGRQQKFIRGQNTDCFGRQTCDACQYRNIE